MTAMDWRQYDSAIGRFVVMDPMAEMKYDNTSYRFAFNNPNFWVDPSGLFESRKEARAYRIKNGISGGITKQKDGTFSINDKKNGVSYSAGDDSQTTGSDEHDNDGVVESVLVTNNESNLVSNGKKVVDYLGLFTAGLEATPGTFRLGTTSRGISPKIYLNAWKGNQYTTTFGLGKLGKGLGAGTAIVGTVFDGVGVLNYYDPKYGPKSKNSVSPAKASMNLGMNAYGFYINPIPALLYSGVDLFYPGGWTGDDKNPGLAKDQDRLNKENKAINPNWQLWPGAMKQ
jgi:hypothetical protein